jgi:hypothetical protein
MFYKLKYDVTVYNVPLATMLLSLCYQLQSTMFPHKILPSSPKKVFSAFSLSRKSVWVRFLNCMIIWQNKERFFDVLKYLFIQRISVWRSYLKWHLLSHTSASHYLADYECHLYFLVSTSATFYKQLFQMKVFLTA